MARLRSAGHRRRVSSREPLFLAAMKQAIFDGSVDADLDEKLAASLGRDRILRSRMAAILNGDPAIRRRLPAVESRLDKIAALNSANQAELRV